MVPHGKVDLNWADFNSNDFISCSKGIKLYIGSVGKLLYDDDEDDDDWAGAQAPGRCNPA